MVNIDDDEVRGFFPQGYFGEDEEEEEIQLIQLHYPKFLYPEDFRAIQRKKDALRRKEQATRRRCQEWIKGVDHHQKDYEHSPPPRPSRFHYLPNPDYQVRVDAGPCVKLGCTWICRTWTGNRDARYVMLRRAVFERVRVALVRQKFVRFSQNIFVSPDFAGRVHSVRLWNFFDPVRKRHDDRFFWVQTIFNPK